MKMILRTAAAAAAMSLTMPALAYTVWPDIDFEWYANASRYNARPAPINVAPAARPGYIWSPAHLETRNGHQIQVAAHWVVDDYDTQLSLYNHPEFVADVR